MKNVADTVSVAKALVEGFAARDENRLLSLFDADAEFWTRVQILDDRHFRGHDAVREWLRTVEEQFDRYEILDTEYVQGTSGCVLVTGRMSFQHRGDSYGQSRAVNWVVCVDESTGKIVWFKSYANAAEARAGAGLTAGA